MSITFLLDENIPYALIDLLEKRGFLVEHLKKIGMRGMKNGEVYKLAEKSKKWIVTRDADFQNYTQRHKYLRMLCHSRLSGIFLLRRMPACPA